MTSGGAAGIGPVLVDDLDRLRARTAAKWTHYGPDVLPAWVAEADVSPHPGVVAAIAELVARGDLGYPGDDVTDALAPAFAARMAERWGWAADPAGVRLLTDVVQGIALALEATTGPGDGVVVLVPSYPPILELVEVLGRRLVPVELRRADGWALPVDAVAAAARAGATAVVLVNPHNPTGRAFGGDELAELAEVTAAHDLVVISDEIHQDLTWDVEHVPFASVSADAAARTVTLTSAAKSHALAGLRGAVAHVGAEVVERFDTRPAAFRGGPSVVAAVATRAAWTSDGTWEAALRAELLERRAQVADFLAEHLPEVPFLLPDATFLAWLDLRPLALGDDPADFFLERAGVVLGSGPAYGAPGIGHARLNFGTGAGVLEEVLERMVTAIDLRAG